METNKNRFQKFLSGLKKSISHNSGIKILSVILAFILWLTVVNYTNPEVTATVKTSVEVTNAEELSRADRIYSLNEKTVNITYKVRTGNRSKIKPSDFRAYIDLSDYSITGAVPVYVEVSSEASEYVSEVRHDPLIVHVTTEDIIRRRFEVQGIVKGSASDGYVVGEIHHDPEVVYITGTSTDISKISEVSFEVDVSGAKEDVKGNEKIILKDIDGKRINLDVKIEPFEYADYKVKIYKTKSLTIKASSEGLPAEGYVVDSIETSPTFISVYGEDSVLENSPYVFVPRSDINIEGAAENRTFNLNINDYLPDGVFLNQGNSDLVVLVRIRSVMQLPEQNIVTVTVPVAVPVVNEQPTTAVQETTSESSEELPEETGDEESSEEEGEQEEISGEETEDAEETEDTEEEMTDDTEEETEPVSTEEPSGDSEGPSHDS